MTLAARIRSMFDSLRKKRPSEVAQSVKEAMGRYDNLFRRLAVSEAIDRVPRETNRVPSLLDDWFLDGRE